MLKGKGESNSTTDNRVAERKGGGGYTVLLALDE